MNKRSRDSISEQLQRVNYVGASVADDLMDELDIQSVAQLVEAARDEKLQTISGIGAARERQILESAEEVLVQVEEAEEAEEAEQGEGTVEVKTVVREPEPTEEEDEQEAEEAEEAEQKEDVEEPHEEAAAPRPRIERFIDRLRCPACGHDTFDRDRTTLSCTACKREYDIHDGIADLAPPQASTSGLAQKVMESGFYARFYEKLARPKLTELVSDRSMQQELALAAEYLELSEESTVLDIACGTGNFTRHFAEEIAASADGYDDKSLVVGMDISWPMLERARSYLRRDGLTDRVFLLRGDAVRIPVGRAAFNRLHCAGALHLMDDIDEALRNFARVLEPGGICVVGTFLLEGNIFKRAAKRFAEIPTHFHWFERDELQERMERAGFSVVTENVSQEAITVKARRT